MSAAPNLLASPLLKVREDITRALALRVPWSYCFIFGPLVNIMAAIPVSLNGLGVREGGAGRCCAW